jgi:cobalt-zinc-cadmium efflux system membrane fusion protein
VACLLSLAALSLTGCREERPRAQAETARPKQSNKVTLPADSPVLRQIRVEPVKTADVPTDEVVVPGKIEVNPNRVSHVLLPVPGRVAEVYVRLGDAVKQGQPILSVESPEADSAMSAFLQSEAALVRARATASKAQSDLDRLRDLFEHDAVARKQVLSAENDLTQSNAAVEQAVASRRQALRRLDILGLKSDQFAQRVTVRSPISGKVLEINVAAGEYRNDTASPLVRVADLSTVWVSSDVPESSIRMIKLGERFDIDLSAYPGESFRGRVTQIADVVDPQTRTVKVRAEMENSRGRLLPEMFCRIRHVDAPRTLPVVPPSTVLQSEGKSVVWLETSPGNFEKRVVETGARAGSMLSVVTGLSVQDRIVVDGATLLNTM